MPDVSIPYSDVCPLPVVDPHFVTTDNSKSYHLPHDTSSKGTYRCPNGYTYAFRLWSPPCTDFTEVKPVVEDLTGTAAINLQWLCHFINSHPHIVEN
jgi:hypothetical protein